MFNLELLANIDDDDENNNNNNNIAKNNYNNERWVGSSMLKVLHLFLLFHKKVKQNLYSFHVLFIKGDRCAATF